MKNPGYLNRPGDILSLCVLMHIAKIRNLGSIAGQISWLKTDLLCFEGSLTMGF